MPQKFNYQGIARDAKGNPLAHQRMTLKLTLLPTSDATEGEYEEIQTVMTNEFGLYTLQIGNGASTSLSTFKDIKWETGKKYIRVAIDPKGGSDFVDAGTNQLLSVPYAIYADKAGMAKNAGGDRTGTVSTNATHVSGDTNFLAKFTGLNVIGKSQLFDNGTNVGVGTTSPLFKLHIQKPTGNADILVRTLDSTGAASLRLRNSAGAELGINKFGPNATGNFMGIPRANMAAVNNFTTGPFVFNSGSDIVFGNTVGPTQIPRMFVSGATGNVGIGTLTPSAKLEVAGQLKITGGNPAVGKILTSDSNGLASWQTSITDSQWASNGTHIFNNNSGNVGIGTNTPSSQLHLASPIAEIRLQNTAINTSLFITAPFNGGTGGIGTDGNHELPFFTNNIERMVIKNDGRMGIGTNVPNARLHVADSAVVFSAIGDTAIATFNNKPPIEGAGRRMMWYPERGAFRAGGVAGIDSVNWNCDNIGAYSVAMGWNTQAKGRSSFASGDNTQAIGARSTALGLGSRANGNNSTAMGENTIASADLSTAFGSFTTASGLASTAMGSGTIASATVSTAIGSSTTASGLGSTAMGRLTKATGDRSTVTGINTQANGFASFVIGQFNDTLVAPQTAMSSTTPLFIIGNGTASNARSNVLVVRNDGKVGVGSNAPVSTLETGASFGAAITTISTNLTLTEAHHTVIITGGTPTITLPSPSAANRRMYILVNYTAAARNVSTYFNLTGTITSSIPPTSSITIQSNGSSWFQIR